MESAKHLVYRKQLLLYYAKEEGVFLDIFEKMFESIRDHYRDKEIWRDSKKAS